MTDAHDEVPQDPAAVDEQQPEDTQAEPNFMHREDVNDFTKVLKMLGDPIRFQVIDVILTRGETDVTDLVELTDATTQPAISHHLGIMKTAGLVEVRRDGKHSYYSVARGETGDLIRRIYALVNPDSTDESSSEE
jgi:ArsR family transcriptional regulator